MIVNHAEVYLEVRDLYENGGLPKGALTGWDTVDELYTVGQGQWTVVTGTPGSGKSEWLDALMVNLAKKDRWRFVIYSPENWPLALHHSKIIEKYTGKPFNPGPNERMTAQEVDAAETWMHGKFLFAKPDKPNITSILNEANAYLPAGDSFKFGVVIDPWNQLEHHIPHGMPTTQYVSQVLSEIIRWVRERNCHLWLVAHPSKMQKNKDGKLPVPTPHDISDSAHFWNKCDAAVTVWRDQSNYKNPEVQIHVQKVRFKHIGHTGVTVLLYDRVTGQYRDMPKAEVVDFKTRAGGVENF